MRMANQTHLNLHPSEQAITLAASHIYAAYIVSGQIDADRNRAMRQAIEEAIEIARIVDERVIAPGEMS
jgi:hypothetical protein